MNPERWRKVDQLLSAALERESSQRASFLAQACEGDEALARDVQILLSAHEAADSFLESPATQISAEDPLSEATLPPQVEVSALERGSALGRYVVLNKLGGGGMGVVYAAYDPELDRKVALKLLRPDAVEALKGEAARGRLLREAQAMARLSHPNVISVHDVGTLGARVFIAMEYVSGETLTRWLKQTPRSPRDVVGIFIQAGKGLAAAHAAGLVHRDFKPDNVLVGRNGQVKVLDFGLARAGEDSKGDAPTLVTHLDTPGPHAPRALDAQLTRSGAFLGTPAYMAPEQLLGQPTDARTDQFSFCVALHEALYGKRPFAGESLEALTQRVIKGDIEESPRTRGVPRWIREILLRGLRRNPDLRFPSMDVLLHQLAKDPWVMRRRAAALGGVTLLLVAAVVGFRQAANRQIQVCRGAAERLSGVWDDPRKRAVSDALLATRTPYAADTAQRVEKQLNGYTREWVEMQTDACQATRVRGVQSEAVLDLRTDCLRRRLEEVKALTQLFAKADAETAEKAVEAAQGLPSLHACADVLSLSAPIKLPQNPALRAEVDTQRRSLAKVQALRDTGKYAEALPLATRTADDSRRIGYKPLEAEATLSLGALQSKLSDNTAEKTLRQAAAAAEAGRNDEVRAKAWITLLEHVGSRVGRAEEGRGLALQASAIVDRLENPPDLSESLQYALGVLSLSDGKFPDATKHLKAALEISEKAFGEDHPRTAQVLTSLSIASRDHGAYQEAASYGRRALQILEKVVGPDHPSVADACTVLGVALKYLGKFDEALKLHQRALEIRERVRQDTPAVAVTLQNIGSVLRSKGQYADAMAANERALAIVEKSLGPEDPEASSILINLGNLSGDLGDYPQAIGYYRRAMPIFEKTVGPEHPHLALTLSNLSATLCDHGSFQAAMGPGLRALAIREKTLGPEHPLTATSLDNIGEIFDGLKNSSKALAYHHRALALHEKAFGPTHSRVARTLTNLGRSYLLAGKPSTALPYLDRALAIFEKGTKVDPLFPAAAKFIKARALWDSGKDRGTALQLGREAYRAFAEAGSPPTKPYLELQAWLRDKSKARGQRISTDI